jgi:hypothetical protein
MNQTGYLSLVQTDYDYYVKMGHVSIRTWYAGLRGSTTGSDPGREALGRNCCRSGLG